jgi:hypothetical protein
MKDKMFDKLPDDQKFNELSIENLMTVEDNLSEHNNVILVDDMTAYLRDSSIKKKLKELVFNRRHKHLSIIFLVQSYMSIDPDIRKLFSNIFVFKCSRKEMEKIFEESVELDKDYVLPIMRAVFDRPFQYLFINTDSQRLFKGFDEILLE